ncbi:hypothetical protein COO60DRAFT_558479 [Scenedesmus sp. NREL 46B-D3]|nr:hypothetical protein COO60DRAFT_558479 [Scenedesmus sp. NREL 46B-D3]
MCCHSRLPALCQACGLVQLGAATHHRPSASGWQQQQQRQRRHVAQRLSTVSRILRRAADNEDLEFYDHLHAFKIKMAVKVAGRPASAAAQQVQVAHKAKLLAVAVVLRQLYSVRAAQEVNWASAGLQGVIAAATSANTTFSSSSTIICASIAGRMRKGWPMLSPLVKMVSFLSGSVPS